MTAFTVSWISEQQRQDFIRLCNKEVYPRLRTQPHGYAKGRRFAWLAWEPSFEDPAVAIERPRGELWEWLESLVPGIETAECWLNGEGSSPGIRPHMDASYAAEVAWVLNLGQTVFRIWLPTGEVSHPILKLKKVNKVWTEYEASLRGGELISFNCKCYHGSRSSALTRWGIGMWTFKAEWRQRARFERVL